jgi:hypothetical protein
MWYGGLYGVLLEPSREQVRCVVEIGIGTVIPKAPSTMFGIGSNNYRPGGSLRAWRDFLPNAAVHGLDVAADTQFAGEGRITTHLCDSTDTEQSAAMLRSIAPLVPDLIIDDGLHVEAAQIATLRNFFPALRPGGLYVVEDVFETAIPGIIETLQTIDPESDFFVDRSWGECVGIVARKATRENVARRTRRPVRWLEAHRQGLQEALAASKNRGRTMVDMVRGIRRRLRHLVGN